MNIIQNAVDSIENGGEIDLGSISGHIRNN